MSKEVHSNCGNFTVLVVYEIAAIVSHVYLKMK